MDFDNIEDFINDDNEARINLPHKSNWICHLLGDVITIHPDEGKEPNWFHRWMHRIFFGARWEKIQ